MLLFIPVNADNGASVQGKIKILRFSINGSNFKYILNILKINDTFYQYNIQTYLSKIYSLL